MIPTVCTITDSVTNVTKIGRQLYKKREGNKGKERWKGRKRRIKEEKN